MAEAAIEERQLLKSLHWYDGFVIALCNPGFLIASLGFTLATVGALGSVILWGISAFVGLLQNWIYSETAAMFPDCEEIRIESAVRRLAAPHGATSPAG